MDGFSANLRDFLTVGNHESIANSASQQTGEDPSFFQNALQHVVKHSVGLLGFDPRDGAADRRFVPRASKTSPWMKRACRGHTTSRTDRATQAASARALSGALPLCRCAHRRLHAMPGPTDTHVHLGYENVHVWRRWRLWLRLRLRLLL